MQMCLIHLMALAILVSLCACRPRTESEPAPEPSHRTYSVTGMVLSLKPLAKEVVVEHEDIPGFMNAMTMLFSVRDTNELAGLIPGEQITFKMIVTDDDAWIEDVEKTGVAENIIPKGSGISIARDVEPLKVGDALPDYDFINEQGQAVSLSQFKGNALVLSFLFTRCPMPQYCPLTAKKLAETQNQLSMAVNGPTNWHILAITIDPEFDTPERLKQFGETHGFKPERWSLLTGERIDITALGEQFGLTFWTEDGTINHNLRTVVVGADGTIRTNIVGNEWKVETLVGEVVEAAGGRLKNE